MQLYKKKSEGPLRAGIRQGFINGTGFGLSMFFLFSVYATCFYAGARLVEVGKTTVPEVFQVFFGLTMTAAGISQSGALAPDTGKTKSAAASIFELL
ncbi:ABC transporter transmembrane domain-containing protein, partial [Klebsiella pneumoniae]|uniref:ABC transporter transmembrane domain-containing protein n=1 Tax=Klebsiella pneumoniae TaxID=573 RepID=UPI0030134731